MLYKIIMTVKLVLIQFDRVLLPRFWFIRGEMKKKNQRAREFNKVVRITQALKLS